MPFPPITNYSHSEAIRQNVISRVRAKVVANPANDTGLDTVYYDGQMMMYRHCDHFSDPAKLSWGEDFAKPYRDYWVIGQGAGQGYRVFSEGLTRQYLVYGTAASFEALEILGSIAGWAQPSGFQDPLNDDIFYSREVAYAGILHLDLFKVGSAEYSASRLEQLATWARGHVVHWTSIQTDGLTKFYIRPFMVALTCYFLMRYYDEHDADPDIVDEISGVLTYISGNVWRSADPKPSFKYTDRNTSTMDPNVPNTDEQAILYDSGDQEATPDLSLLIVAPYGWMYSKTLAGSWIVGAAMGDEIYSNGVAIYENDGANTTDFWISGASFGTLNNTAIQGKQYNQNYWLSDLYLGYREASTPTGRCKGAVALLGAG